MLTFILKDKSHILLEKINKPVCLKMCLTSLSLKNSSHGTPRRQATLQCSQDLLQSPWFLGS